VYDFLRKNSFEKKFISGIEKKLELPISPEIRYFIQFLSI